MHIASSVTLRARERNGAFADIPLQQVASRVADMPEKRLMLAVLLDAIVQLRRPGSTGAAEASRWIHGENDADDTAFSFRSVCDALGLDPEYLSRGVFGWARGGSDVVRLHPTPLRRPQARALRMTARRRRERSAVAM
jgi:hypothetical protein